MDTEYGSCMKAEKKRSKHALNGCIMLVYAQSSWEKNLVKEMLYAKYKNELYLHVM